MATIPSTEEQLSMGDNFRPFYSPSKVLDLGVFGGTYFQMFASRQLLPEVLFNELSQDKYARIEEDFEANYFGVASELKDYNMELPSFVKSIHPKGWFQWYCGYFYGRNTTADTYRLLQWRRCIEACCKKIRITEYTGELTPWTDDTFLPGVKQLLLQYAWDPTKDCLSEGVIF